MGSTLSTQQWQRLQSLFGRAETLDRVAAEALVAAERSADPVVAGALAAMLTANRQWADHTGAAVAALSAAVMPSAVGTRLGAFVLLREIGRGGMGVVYLGERSDGRVQQQVAIKVLHAGSLDEHTRERFQREREILAAFDHPGIARLLDAGESAAGEPYYVMEYLRGSPIDVHCDEQRLGIAERLRLFRGVCDAVQYAHSKLILHRDIKPSNVIIDSQGVPRLIDFGIARPLVAPDAARLQQTVEQQRYFSPVNAAPEQLRGEAAAVTCDVYQLGTLLHELLCGSPIFAVDGDSLAELERKIAYVVPSTPSQTAASVPEAVASARRFASGAALAKALRGDLDAIVQRAVRKEPAQRYRSVEQLAQDLERHRQDLPVLGRRGDRRYRLGRFVRRHRRSLAAAVVAMLGVGMFTMMLVHQVRQTAAERDRAVNAGRSAEAVTEFLLTVFRAGDPAVAKRANVPIGEALDHARGLLEPKLADEPAIRARIAGTLAGIYASIGEYGTASGLSTQALALLDATPGIDPEAVLAELRQNIEVLLMDSQFDKLQPQVDRLQALEAAHRPGMELPWLSRLRVIQVRWQSDAADACRQAEALTAEMFAGAEQDPEGFVRTLLYTAKTCRVPGEDAAQRTLERIGFADGLVRRRMDGDATLLLWLKFARGNTLRRLKRYDEAITLIAEAAADSARMYGPDSVSEANAWLVAGGANITAYRFPQALEVLHKAQAIYAKVHGDAPSGDIAVVAYQLGVAYDYGKIDAAAALKWYAKAYEVGQVAFGKESGNIGSFAADYGTLLRKSGDFAAAEPVLRRASMNTKLDNPLGNGFMARMNLAIVLARRERWDEVAALVAECEQADAEFREDPEFKADWEALRAALARKQST
ncbi:serine/threonine-protein kinase [Tahibacter sp.]|uniref:serine/threonine protein kinase n=1 Tax=Tahibacter sp. TaxID=2056211 RepID=UPI0028C41FFC|nr:serine/threonine-protein kinase [Tahibacter sp.]